MKITNLFVALLCILSICLYYPQKILANTEMQIYLESNVYGSPGEVVTIKLKINNNPGIVGMELSMILDEGLEVKKCELSDSWGTLKSRDLDYNNTIIPNKLLWTAKNYEKVSANGEFITLYIEIADNAELGEHNIIIDNLDYEIYDEDLNSISANITNSSIDVIEPPIITNIQGTTEQGTTTIEPTINPIKGDINFDNKIDIVDLYLIKSYYFNFTLLDYNQIRAGDIDEDGVLSPYDIYCLKEIILAK